MKKSILSLVGCLFLCAASFANAQFTTVTASLIKIGGTTIGNGTVCAVAVDANDNPVTVELGGGGLYGAGSSCATVSSGAITGAVGGGTYQLPDEAAAGNPGFNYDFTITDTGSNLHFVLHQVPGVHSTTWALDHYFPVITVPTVQAFTFTSGSGAPTTSCIVKALYQDISTPTAPVLYQCGADGTFHVITGSGGSASIANTTNVLKGNNAGAAIAATPGTDYATPAQVTAAQSAAQTASDPVGTAATAVAAIPQASSSAFGLVKCGTGITCTGGVASASGTAGVASIDTQTGAFTFSGAGVSHTGTAYTFAGAAGAALIANNLSDLANVVTARTNLGLGTAATTASSAYDAAGAATTAQTTAEAVAANASNLSSGTVALARLPALTLAQIAAGVAGTGTYDFRGASHFLTPSAAGYTAATAGEIGYDSTNLNMHFNVASTDLVMLGVPSSSLPTNGHCAQFTKIGNWWEVTDAGAACGTGGSGITTLTSDVTASGTGSVAATVTGINSVNLAGLGTGILKLASGVPSLALAADIQNALATDTVDNSSYGFSTGSGGDSTCPTAVAGKSFFCEKGGVIQFVQGAGSYAAFVNGVANAAITTSGLNQFAATTSAQLAGVISDELGSGQLIFSAGTLAIAAGKTLTVSNSISLAGTDGTTFTLPGASDTIAGLAAAQAFTNKTVDGVTPTTFGFVDATSSIQTQLNSKQATLAPTFSNQTDGATVTWAIGSAVIANASLTMVHTTSTRALNLTGLVNGGSYVIIFKQDSTGGAAATLGTGCTWFQGGSSGYTALTTLALTTTASAINILAFTYDGTNCYANLR